MNHESLPARIDDLAPEELRKLLVDFFHRIVIHYALWFTEVRHQMGLPKALDMLGRASRRKNEFSLLFFS